MNWYEDDSGFSSCGQDGAIYTWSLKDCGNREDEYLDKGTTFFSVVKVPE